MSTTSHWAVPYIGQPWIAGAHDCRAFAEKVWRERFGWNVSLLEVRSERRRWRPVDRPIEGDGVLMLRNGQPHVGVWVEADGGGVLHCLKGRGVEFHNARRMADERWHEVRFYRRQA